MLVVLVAVYPHLVAVFGTTMNAAMESNASVFAEKVINQ